MTFTDFVLVETTNWKTILDEFDSIKSVKTKSSTLVVTGKIGNKEEVKSYDYKFKTVAEEVAKRLKYFLK